MLPRTRALGKIHACPCLHQCGATLRISSRRFHTLRVLCACKLRACVSSLTSVESSWFPGRAYQTGTSPSNPQFSRLNVYDILLTTPEDLPESKYYISYHPGALLLLKATNARGVEQWRGVVFRNGIGNPSTPVNTISEEHHPETW